jgi:hypothetical protein
LTNAFWANHGLTFFFLPADRSPLVRPLDRRFFKRIKTQFSLFQILSAIWKGTLKCKPVVIALQAVPVTSVVWKSREHFGMVPRIAEGTGVGWDVNSDKVLAHPSRNDGPPPVKGIVRRRRATSPDVRAINSVHLPTGLDGECSLYGQDLQLKEA